MVLQQVRSAQEQWHRLNWLYRLAQAIERVQFRIGIKKFDAPAASCGTNDWASLPRWRSRLLGPCWD